MKGLALSEAYFEAYRNRLFEGVFAMVEQNVAVGLAGEGSECLGYDDAISRDHDFGPGFAIWLPESGFEAWGGRLQEAYDQLPAVFMEIRRRSTPEGAHRVGVASVEGFYRRFTGKPYGPETLVEWLQTPEHFLAACTSGKVFLDNKGMFTEVREKLLAFYPEDIRKKKLAARLCKMGQGGQYNYLRSCRRGAFEAAYLALHEFIENALSAIFLLDKVYMPFYKWAFRRAEELPQWSAVVRDLKDLTRMPEENAWHEKVEKIESICEAIAARCRAEGLSQGKDVFLVTQGKEIMKGIDDLQIAGLPPEFDL